MENWNEITRHFSTFFPTISTSEPIKGSLMILFSHFLILMFSLQNVASEFRIFFILSYQDILIKHASFGANVRSLQMLKNLNWKDDLKFCQLHQFHPSIAFHHQGTWKACHGAQDEWRMIVQFNCSFLAELLYPGRQLEDGYKLDYLRCQVFKPSRDLIWFKEKKSFVE